MEWRFHGSRGKSPDVQSWVLGLLVFLDDLNEALVILFPEFSHLLPAFLGGGTLLGEQE